MQLQGLVGRVSLADSVNNILRQGRTSEMIASQLQPRMAETTARGGVYSLTQNATATAISAGNLINAAAAAATQFALWNPIGSGVNVSLLKFSFGVISATTMPTTLFHGLFVNGVPTINSTYDSAEGAVNSLAGSGAPRAKYVNTASNAGTTLSGGSAPITFRQSNAAFSATTFVSASGTNFVEMLDGDIVLPPGTGWLPLWSGAGSAVLNAYSVTWEEVPIY